MAGGTQPHQIRDDPKKGLHDVQSFIGAWNFYRRHIHNFTYSSAPVTHLIKKTNPSMRTAGVLESWSLRDYQAEYQCVLSSLSDGLEARLIDGDRWYKDNQYLYYEDRIVVPEARLDGCLQWADLSSGRTGCNSSVYFFRDHFYSPLTCVELRARMQSIVDSCGSRPQTERRT